MRPAYSAFAVYLPWSLLCIALWWRRQKGRDGEGSLLLVPKQVNSCATKDVCTGRRQYNSPKKFFVRPCDFRLFLVVRGQRRLGKVRCEVASEKGEEGRESRRERKGGKVEAWGGG